MREEDGQEDIDECDSDFRGKCGGKGRRLGCLARTQFTPEVQHTFLTPADFSRAANHSQNPADQRGPRGNQRKKKKTRKIFLSVNYNHKKEHNGTEAAMDLERPLPYQS